ncbi:hypothetical protein FRC12_009660 [Ceratobasidium sp. 428]|nr:hypothetical protein FRC12_009660 [Ceratobasidium sp. 428]
MFDTHAARVFSDSALLNMICNHLCRQDILSLLRTSRPTFNSIAPRIWKTLDSVGPLLMLLTPNVELKKPKEINKVDCEGQNEEKHDKQSDGKDDGNNKHQGQDEIEREAEEHEEYKGYEEDAEEEVLEVTLPAFSSHIFERFNRYNVFIRKLSISNAWDLGEVSYTRFRLLSWSTLSRQARRAPLLPNLHDLSIQGELMDGGEVTLWLSTFVSPSLRTLGLWFNHGDFILSHHDTAIVLGLLTQKCPQLRKLSHKLSITDTEYDHEYIEHAAASQLVLTPLACGHLQNSRHLAQLTIRGYFINSETLVALSCLPKLEELTIAQGFQPNEHLPQAFKDSQLSEGSFPALRYLRIRSHILDDFLSAWNTYPLVSGLTRAFLEHLSTKERRVGPIYEDTILRPLLLSITTSSPNIQNLMLRSTRMDRPLSIDLASSSWTCTQHLSLRYLKLTNFEVDAVSLKNVQQIWHKLDILDMPDQLLTLQHLAHLSRLPKLKKICAAGFKDITEQISEAQLHEGSPLHTIHLTKPSTDRVKIKYTEKVAR